MCEPLLLDDFIAPTGFADPRHLEELRRPVSDALRGDARALAEQLMIMAEFREALPADLGRPAARTANVPADKRAALASMRGQAISAFDALISQQRPEGLLARQAAMLEIIALAIGPLTDRPRDLLRRRWERFERGCFLAAVTHWAREHAVRIARTEIPPDAGPYRRRALAAHHKTQPWVRLFLTAHRQFLEHQSPLVAAAGEQATARRIAHALNVLSAALCYLPRMTPPIVQRRLRAMHREMLGAVNESFGVLANLHRLGMDPPSTVRLHIVGIHRPQAAASPRRRRTSAMPSAPAAAAPPPAAAPAPAAPGTTREEEGERRDAMLGLLFDEPLRPAPQRRGDAPDLSAGARSLGDMLPAAERILLGFPESAPARSSEALEAAGRSLTNLWGWFHEHRAYGYLRLGQRVYNRQNVLTPEQHWIKLLNVISLLYDGLRHSGFRDQEDLNDFPSHIGVSTYIGHRAYSCDVTVPIRTPVRMARPDALSLSPRAVGPALAPGDYSIARSGSVPVAINAAQEAWAKILDGYFGGLRGFNSSWADRVDAITRGYDPERRQHTRSALAAAGGRLRQFVLTAYPNISAELQVPTFLPADLPRLLNSAPAGGIRRPDPDTFLAAIFFRGAVLDTGATLQTASRFQASARAALLTDLNALASRAEHAEAIRRQGWTLHAWSEFLRLLFQDWSSMRGVPRSWRAAIIPDDETRIRLIGQLPAPAAGASGVLPAGIGEVRGSAPSVPSGALLVQARQEIDRALGLILTMTTEALARPRQGDEATPLHEHVLRFVWNPRGQPERVGPVIEPEELSSEAEVDLRVQTLPHPQIDESRPYSEGNWVQAQYEYGRSAGGATQPGPARILFQLEFMHMTSLGQAVRDSAAARPGEVTVSSPLLGRTGSSGNANTPHAHMQIVIKGSIGQSGSLNRAVPLAAVSIYDFLGPLPWLGPIATGPWPPP